MLPAALSALLAPTPMQPVMCSCNRRVRMHGCASAHACIRQADLAGHPRHALGTHLFAPAVHVCLTALDPSRRYGFAGRVLAQCTQVIVRY
jgi:hypothetical protein